MDWLYWFVIGLVCVILQLFVEFGCFYVEFVFGSGLLWVVLIWLCLMLFGFGFVVCMGRC